MKLSWESITVQQFQDIYKLSLNTNADEMTKVERVIGILFDKTEQQVENLSMSEFKDYANQCAFIMSGDIPGKPIKKLKANGKKFYINYDPKTLRHRQYVEMLHFGKKPMENMHLIMASVVQPVNWFGVRGKNDADNHDEIANDLLNARVIDVYHSCLFFCKLYINLINNIKAYLAVDMMSQGLTMNQAQELVRTSMSVMGGFIAHEKWQLLRD